MQDRQQPIAEIHVITVILAFCSLQYGLLMAETVRYLAAHTVWAYTLTLGLYLASMGLGAWKPAGWKGRLDWDSLARVEIALSVFGGISVFLIHAGHIIWGHYWLSDLLVTALSMFLLFLFLSVFAVGYLSGAELPILISLANSRSSKPVTNRVLAMDYLGALVCGILFPLVFLARYEPVTIALGTGFVNLLVAMYVVMKIPAERKTGMISAITGLVLAVLLVGLVRHRDVEQYLLKKYYYFDMSGEPLLELFEPLGGLPDVERYHTPYQKIDIVDISSEEDPYEEIDRAFSRKLAEDPAFPSNRVLFLNGRYQVWTNFEEHYHEYFAHVPVQLNGSVPEDILILGGGDGFLLKEILKYSAVRSVTLVDIDRRMIELAREHPVLGYSVRDAYDDPRVRVVIDDAFPYMRQNRKKYDAVYLDFPQPADYELSKLYSREFYIFVKRSLSDGGFAAMDAPGMNETLTKKEDRYVWSPSYFWKRYHATLESAGFGTIRPFMSTLETDNPRAEAVIRQKVGTASVMHIKDVDWGFRRMHKIEGTEAIVRYMMEQYSRDYEEGFVFLRADASDIRPQYADFGIETYLMNEKRFHLALDVYPDYTPPFRQEWVNSIWKPTLPGTYKWWELRKPY